MDRCFRLVIPEPSRWIHGRLLGHLVDVMDDLDVDQSPQRRRCHPQHPHPVRGWVTVVVNPGHLVPRILFIGMLRTRLLLWRCD